MKLDSSEYKEIARESLKGKWLTASAVCVIASLLGAFSSIFLFIIIYMGYTYVIVGAFENIWMVYATLAVIGIIVAWIRFFFGGMTRFGVIDFNLALLDRRKTGLSMVFRKKTMLWKGVLMRLYLFFTKLIGCILLLIPGIIMRYAYAMTPYILEQKPGFEITKAMRASRKVMKKHKWQLFKLRLSFLGWDILSIITFGLGYIFVRPYKEAAETVFYNEISGRADALYGRTAEM